MSSSLYQQALSLYNQGDYEGAWDLLHDADLETEQEKMLFKECDKLVTEQAAYILKSYIDEGEFKKAKEYRLDFYTKYGSRALVDAIEIPEYTQVTQNYTQSIDELGQEQQIPTEQTSVANKEKISLRNVYAMIAVVLVLVIGGGYYLSSKKDNNDIEWSNQISIENQDQQQSDSVLATDIENKPNKFEYIKKHKDHYDVDIEWPISLTGITNISSIQKLIIRYAFGKDFPDDIYASVEKYFEEWQKIDPLGDDGTEGRIQVNFQQRLNDLYIFKIQIYAYTGGGTGASVYSHDEYVYFDKRTERELHIDDIFIDKSFVLEIVNRHISHDDRCYDKAEKLPDNIILSTSGITFIFPKYSIAAGAYGEVDISVDYDDIENVLSEDFKKAIGRL